MTTTTNKKNARTYERVRTCERTRIHTYVNTHITPRKT